MSDSAPVQPHIFTLGEAAKAAGVSKPTISKAIKSGRLSAEQKPDGSYSIQAAELFRVFPPGGRHGTPKVEGDAPVTGVAVRGLPESEVNPLSEQLAREREERERERQQLTEQIEDLRRRLDTEGEERRKLMAILTDQRAKPAEPQTAPPQPAPAPKRGIFSWFRGRG